MPSEDAAWPLRPPVAVKSGLILPMDDLQMFGERLVQELV